MAVSTAEAANSHAAVQQQAHTLQLPFNNQGQAANVGRRPSRFKPVRFQEYHMQWRSAASAASVSDVYVLLPDRCVLAAAALAAQETSLALDACFPDDSKLAGTISFEVCDCQGCGRHPSTSVSATLMTAADISWTRQPVCCRHTERCHQRVSRSRATIPNPSSELAGQHPTFLAPPLPPLPLRTFSPPPQLPPLPQAAKKPPQSVNPPPSSPAELRPAVPPPTPNQRAPLDLGRAEFCAESCAATVAHMLQGVLLAAVRAETEPLERQLAEKEAELCRLRGELQERDARVHRLLKLLACRQLLYADARSEVESTRNRSSSSNIGSAGVIGGSSGDRTGADFVFSRAPLSPSH